MENSKLNTALSVCAIVISIIVGAITIGDRVYFYTFSKKAALQAELREVMGAIVQIKLNNIDDGLYANPSKPSYVHVAQSGQNRALAQRGLVLIEQLEGELGPEVYSFFGGELAERGDWEGNILMLEKALMLVDGLPDTVGVTRDLATAYYQPSARQDMAKSRALFAEVKEMTGRLHPSYHLGQYALAYSTIIKGELINENCSETQKEMDEYLEIVRSHSYTNAQIILEAETLVRNFKRSQKICGF